MSFVARRMFRDSFSRSKRVLLHPRSGFIHMHYSVLIKSMAASQRIRVRHRQAQQHPVHRHVSHAHSTTPTLSTPEPPQRKRPPHHIPSLASPDFDPSNTAVVFHAFSTFRLLKYSAMFSLLSLQGVSSLMIKLMLHSMNTTATSSATNNAYYAWLSALVDLASPILSTPLLYLVRKQYFPLFTGGENIEQCIQIAKFYCEHGIHLTIDNSTEEGESAEVYARNLALKKQLVDVSAANMARSVSFVSVKPTSLSSPILLEEMSAILAREQPLNGDPTPFMSEAQLSELQRTIDRIYELCDYAKQRNMAVWLDAEQFSRQPGINYVSRRLMQMVNTSPERIYLYNTYQCYLKEALHWIAFDVEQAKVNGYVCGVKLVRGAYLEYESAKAKRENKENPIRDSKNGTDDAYDAAVQYIMEEITESYDSVGVSICTHNRQSLELATQSMQRLGISRGDNKVHFAQLNGMVDNLTFALSYAGYNAYKLLPYGSFEDVWPFLMRRFEENSQILNGSQQEKSLYYSEIKRRLKSLIAL